MEGHQNGQDLEYLPCEESLEKRHLWEDLTGAHDAYSEGVEKMDPDGPLHSAACIFLIYLEWKWHIQYSVAGWHTQQSQYV